MFEINMLGFEMIKKLYVDDHDFGKIYIDRKKRALKDFYRLDDFLFKESKLCVPKSSMKVIVLISRSINVHIMLSQTFF